MMIIPAIWITELALIVSSSQLPSISQAMLKSLYSSALFSARGIMTFYYRVILGEVGNWKVESGNCLWPSLDLNVPHPRFYPGSTYSPWFKTSEFLLLSVQCQDNCSAPARWTESEGRECWEGSEGHTTAQHCSEFLVLWCDCSS